MMMRPALSVVIVSFNTRKVTCECLETLFACACASACEVIVVDNASADGSSKEIRQRFPAVNLIQSTRNLGFAAGQNLGLLHSNGDAVLILNSDVMLQDNALDRLRTALHDSDPKVAAIGPRVRQADGNLAPSARRAMHRLPLLVRALGVVNLHFGIRALLPERFMRRYLSWLLGRFHDNYRNYDRRQEVDFVDGMCVLVKREVLEEVGLFDEQYFFDMEIIDLSNRIREAGWTIEFDPSVEVVHLGHASRRTNRPILIETIRSHLIYMSKYSPLWEAKFLQSLHLLTSSAKLAFLRAYAYFRPFNPELKSSIGIYAAIKDVCRSFTVRNTVQTSRIPRLKSASRAAPHVKPA